VHVGISFSPGRALFIVPGHGAYHAPSKKHLLLLNFFDYSTIAPPGQKEVRFLREADLFS